MPIRQRNNKWQVDVAIGGIRKQKSVDTEIEAKTLELELTKEIQEELEGKTSTKWTLETAVKKTFALVWKDGKSVKTHEKNSKLMKEYFGKDTLLSDIGTDEIDQWISDMEEAGNSGSTINRKLACLSKVMSVAMDRGALDKKPRFERQQEGTGRIRWLSIEEEKSLLGLLKKWGKDDHHDVVVFLLDTGCRPSEAYKLNSTTDVSFETGLVHFWDTKNGSPRSIPMTLRVREILQRRTKNSVRPFPFNDAWLRNQWDRARNLMGFAKDPGFIPYCCRHTCASRMAQRGVPLVVIQKWMGHKTIQITLRYAHLSPEALQAGLKAIEAYNAGDNISSSG